MAATAERMVSVGCKLPQGLILEVGYKVVPGGVERDPVKYRRVTLNGANQHSQVVGQLRTPSPKALKPGITHNVPEDVFDEWVRRHANSNIVRNGLVFKASNAADITAMAIDAEQRPTGMEAVDPTKHPGIEKRVDD